MISRQRLLDEVWGYDPFSTTNTIEVFVSNLRRKLEAAASRACCTRSGEPATSFAHSVSRARRRASARISASFDRLPIRMRLAGVSALLTFVILCAFAVAIGSLTVHRIRADFNRQVTDTANQLPRELGVYVSPRKLQSRCDPAAAVGLRLARRPRRDQDPHARRNAHRAGTGESAVTRHRPPAPRDGATATACSAAPADVRIVGNDELIGQVIVQYGRRVSDTEATVARVELFLLLGVLAGTAPGAAGGHDDRPPRDGADRRAHLDRGGDRAHARSIARRAPAQGRRRGLRAGAHARGDAPRARRRALRRRESMLARQRQFVADASHELRTPLTSVLANLELLAESLQRRSGRRGPLGPALVPAHAPPGRRPAAARAHRRRSRRAPRAVRPRADRR